MLDSEAAAIRMDLKRALIRIGEMESAMGKLQDDNARLKDENARLKKDNARLEARLAFYGSANMSSSTTSIYNAARKKFRKGRGEKVSGNPGEKIKGSSEAEEGMGAMAAKARMAATATGRRTGKDCQDRAPCGACGNIAWQQARVYRAPRAQGRRVPWLPRRIGSHQADVQANPRP